MPGGKKSGFVVVQFQRLNVFTYAGKMFNELTDIASGKLNIYSSSFTEKNTPNPPSFKNFR